MVTGGTGSDNGIGCSLDFYTAKYAAADGVLLWEKRYNGPGNGSDVARAVAVDAGGNVVVTGSSYNGTNSDYYTVKYAAADGALVWEKHHNGQANSDDYASAVAVDGSGNVVVTGVSDARLNASIGLVEGDYYTAKYAAADGALLWEQSYIGPTNKDDQGQAVAVDGSGNVVVTGISDGRRVSCQCLGEVAEGDYYTAKYAAADGALLWEQRYNGPGNSYDSARAVAVDGPGNVVVTGISYNGDPYCGGTPDYYTAKYAAANGALLWEKHYDGPANGDDNASSLALGPNGMVAITGSSFGNVRFANGLPVVDYATVVYRDLPPVSFAAWAACSGLSAGAAAADADPDSDGLPNAVEYILGGNPTVPGTSGRPTASASGADMILTFPHDDASETPDVTLTVEAGTNLLTWPTVFHIGPNTAASSPGVSISENGTAPDTITVIIPQGKATRLFARLKVRIAP